MRRGQTVGREDVYWVLRNWTPRSGSTGRYLLPIWIIPPHSWSLYPLGRLALPVWVMPFFHVFSPAPLKEYKGLVKESGVFGKVATSAHLETCHMASSILFFWLSGSFLQLKLLLSFVISGIKRIFPIVYFTFIVLFHILLNYKLNLWKTEVWQWLTLGISASKPHSVPLGCQGQGENLIESSGTLYEYDSFDLVEFQNLYFSVTLSTKRI